MLTTSPLPKPRRETSVWPPWRAGRDPDPRHDLEDGLGDSGAAGEADGLAGAARGGRDDEAAGAGAAGVGIDAAEDDRAAGGLVEGDVDSHQGREVDDVVGDDRVDDAAVGGDGRGGIRRATTEMPLVWAELTVPSTRTVLTPRGAPAGTGITPEAVPLALVEPEATC